jgi:hypothetical protein
MISGFQFRAALITSKDTAQNIANQINITPSRFIILKKQHNLELLKCHKSTSAKLIKYFNEINIYFPQENTIEYNHIDMLKIKMIQLY